jgi:hypothetical protein
MTRERALELAAGTSPTAMYVDLEGKSYRGPTSAAQYVERIADVILAAVAEERERCIKAAEDMLPGDLDPNIRHGAATRIRITLER